MDIKEKYRDEIKKEILAYFKNQLDSTLFWKEVQSHWDNIMPRENKQEKRRREHYAKSVRDKRNKLKIVKEILKGI